jgi:hypothetical protein
MSYSAVRVRFGGIESKVARCLFGVLCLGAATSAAAGVIPISFNDFFADPAAQVSISADGSTATLAESDAFGLISLSNVPGLGDPNVVVAANGATLQFDYALDLPAGNTDVFHVALLDGTTGAVLDPLFEFFSSATGSGTIQFDLSSLVGQTLGLSFELASNDSVYSATLALSNLQIVSPTSVAEPPTLLLMCSSLLMLVAVRRRAPAGSR